MHTDIVDDKGRRRGSMFYKAAFYDQRADLGGMLTRYRSSQRYDGGSAGKSPTHVVYGAFEGENLIHETGRFEYMGRDYKAQDDAGKEAVVWLNDNYPDWTNPLAYWD